MVSVVSLCGRKSKGGAAGKGVKKPRMTAAEKALLPQGFRSGCGKQGVVGKQHSGGGCVGARPEAAGAGL